MHAIGNRMAAAAEARKKQEGIKVIEVRTVLDTVLKASLFQAQHNTSKENAL